MMLRNTRLLRESPFTFLSRFRLFFFVMSVSDVIWADLVGITIKSDWTCIKVSMNEGVMMHVHVHVHVHV